MKKNLIILLGVFGVLLFPNMVLAAEVKIDSAKDESGLRELSLVLSIPSNETVENVSYKCEIDNLDLGFDVKYNKSIFGISDGYYVSQSESDLEDKLVIGTLEITNQNTSLVNYKVDCDVKINGTSSKITKNANVKAKEVVKVTSDDARLSLIEVSQGTFNIPFDPDTTEYVIYGIADTINSIRFKTVNCNQGECTYDISGGKSATNKTVTLNQGSNSVQINVTSSDGTGHLTYNFIIYRGETSYNSAKLSTLSIDKYKLSPAFSKDVYEYTLTVPNKVNGVASILDYKAEDENAIVEVKGVDSFQEGNNDLIIAVTNVLGDTTNVYKIVVNRMSSSAIEVKKYFNDEVTYVDAAGNENTVPISEFEVLFNEEYKKIVNGEYKFDKDGNYYEVEEETVEEVKEEKEEKKGDKKFILIIIILGAVLIIILSAYFLFRKKKPKDEENKDEDIDTQEDEEEVEEPKTKEIGEGFNKEKSISIDAALTDLMNTKQYEFEDDDEESEDNSDDDIKIDTDDFE